DDLLLYVVKKLPQLTSLEPHRFTSHDGDSMTITDVALRLASLPILLVLRAYLEFGHPSRSCAKLPQGAAVLARKVARPGLELWLLHHSGGDGAVWYPIRLVAEQGVDQEPRAEIGHFGNGGEVPVNPARYVGRYVLNNMLSVTFGTRTGSVADPLVKRALPLGMEFMRLTGPWSNAVDFIKPLQWIPTRTRSRGRKLRQDFLDVYGAMVRLVKERMDSGEDVPDCLVKSLFAFEKEEQLSWTAMCMFTTAFATGVSHCLGVRGGPRPRTSRLPYVRAIVKEVLRCHSPSWMATPQCLDADFVYRGMYIPANTVMMLNCYSLYHNEERDVESPFETNPDRFIDDNLSSAGSSKQSNPMDRDHWAFGAGRRIHPGMPVAEKEIFLAFSRLLWAFCIGAVPGKPPCLEEYDGNSGCTPLPFEVHLVPRHDQVGAVLDAKEEEIPTGLVWTDDIDFKLA
ncbi:hypothetical protein EVJ58_g9703, partial [Rhodofomes roseus]